MSPGPITPPLIKRALVELPPEQAFELFTEGMGRWWPLHSHSIAADSHEGRLQATGLIFEPHRGGRIYEVMSNGTEGDWGTVLAWEPPKRVVFSWKPSLADRPFTEVEVRFTGSEVGTEVELEHRGWEKLGDEGARLREGYDSGWPTILEILSGFAGTQKMS